MKSEDVSIDELLNSAIELDRENFGIQQDKPFDEEGSVGIGTQMEKILLGNGINMIPDKIFPNLFDESLLTNLGIETENDKLSGQDLYIIFTNLSVDRQNILQAQIYNSLGLDEKGEWKNSIETLESVQKLADKRLANYQDKEILGLKYIVEEKDSEGNYVNNYYTKEEIKEKKFRA